MLWSRPDDEVHDGKIVFGDTLSFDGGFFYCFFFFNRPSPTPQSISTTATADDRFRGRCARPVNLHSDRNQHNRPRTRLVVNYFVSSARARVPSKENNVLTNNCGRQLIAVDV